MLDVELSLTIAKYIGVKDKQCWYHTLRAFFLIEDLQSGWYVEGWAILEKAELRLPIEHGWLERSDGSIIDPAWALLGNKKVDYFPGISYSYAHAATLTKGKKDVLPPLISQKYTDPFDHPAYFQAYKKSFKAAIGHLPTELDRLFMIRLRTGL